MAILDPQRFCHGVPVGVRERDQVLIYRLKEDLRDLGLSFPDRKVEPVLIEAPVKGTPELELANKLEAYCALREARLRDEPVKIRNASAFLRSGLQQRLLSSVEAFWRTLIKHKRTIEEQRQHHGERRRMPPRRTWTSSLWPRLAEVSTPTMKSSKGSTTTEPSPSEPIEEPATVEAERQTEKATLATLGNPDHPSFAQEMKLLTEMLEMAESGSTHAGREAEKAVRVHRPEHARRTRPRLSSGDHVERPPYSHLHRIRRHAHVR